MRYLETVLDSRQHEKHVFQIKRSEIDLIRSLLANAVRHTPDHPDTIAFLSQCRAILRTLKTIPNQPNQPTQ